MAVKGAVLGDILGSQYEFTRPKDLDWINTPLISDYPLGFTDDTVMTLAIKKALTKGTDIIETMVDVGRKYPHCGYGGTFYRWINGPIHKPYNSWGNGSAMRTSYIGEAFEDYDEMQRIAAEVAAVSHNHPEGIKGAVVTSTCIWMAKHGKSKEEIYNSILYKHADMLAGEIADAMSGVRGFSESFISVCRSIHSFRERFPEYFEGISKTGGMKTGNGVQEIQPVEEAMLELISRGKSEKLIARNADTKQLAFYMWSGICGIINGACAADTDFTTKYGVTKDSYLNNAYKRFYSSLLRG